MELYILCYGFIYIIMYGVIGVEKGLILSAKICTL